MASKQRKAAGEFTATFPPETIQQWKRMVKEWEADSSRPNPYISNDRGGLYCPVQVLWFMLAFLASKLSEIRLRLLQEEAAEAERGQRLPHEVTPSVFIRMGLDLEDQQYVSIPLYSIVSIVNLRQKALTPVGVR